MFKKIFIFVVATTIAVSCKTTQKVTKNTTDTQEISDIELIRDSASLEGKQKNMPSWAAKKWQYHPEKPRKNALVHTKLDVSFDWTKQHLHGVATITAKPYFYPQNILELDAKGFDVHSIKLLPKGLDNQSVPLNVRANAKDLKYDYDKKVIKIYLDKTYKRNEEYVVEIKYTAKPNELPKGGSKAITSDKGLYFINPLKTELGKPQQIWTQGETEASSCWFPTIDSPNQRCTQETYITIDKKFATLSNGKFISSKINADGTKTDYWKMDLPHAPYLFMMAIGEYAVVKDKAGDVELSYYVEPSHEKYAKAIFGNTPEMIKFFEEKLGYKYPWNKYAQVILRDFVSGAMENTTASTFMEAVQVDDRELLDQNWDNIIAHELFHQWFGDLVTCESWANLPLNEAFANYSEYLWTEHKLGVEEADMTGQDELAQYLGESAKKQEPLIRYYYKDREDMFDSHSYAKGGRILHMLRKYVGDEAFFKSLNLYLNQHKFTSVEVNDLRLAFEDTIGEDLSWFFNQWFLNPGHPDLKVTHTYANGKVALSVQQLQDSLYTPIYKLPLTIGVWENGAKKLYPIEINKAVQTFEFTLANKPNLVVFDTETQLVGIIKHEKTEDELIFQYYNTEKYLTRWEALDILSKSDLTNKKIHKVFVDALNDKHWRLRELAVEKFNNYTGSDATIIKDKLKKLAFSDPRSYVRAAAINALATYEDDNQALFKKALEDKSYAVVTNALYAYANKGGKDATQQITQFEGTTNAGLLGLVAEYYATTGDTTKYDWYLDKIKTTTNFSKYNIIQAFGKYLKNNTSANQNKGVKYLETLARTDETYWIRFSAFQSLNILKDDVKGLNDVLDEIKKGEQDPELKKLYDLLP